MTPLERLLLEEIPTGTFGGTGTAPPRQLTTEDRATHLRELAHAIAAHDDDTRHHRHLTAVPDRSTAA